MNKNGFTLIEIIICIALISVIGTGTIIGFNIKNKKSNEKLNQKIETAVEIYLNSEKDKDNITYINGIQNGAKGLFFTINDLYKKGYLSEKIVTTLEKETKKDRNELKLLASESLYNDNSKECGTGFIKIDFSWTTNNVNEPLYLCPKNKNKNYTIDEVVNDIKVVKLISNKLKVNLDKFAVSQEFYNNSEDKSNLVVENGIYTFYDDNVKKVYNYYRGHVDNNYLKLGKDNEGNDLYWRILWLDDNNLMKIVLDEEVPISISSKNNENIKINVDDTIYGFITYKNSIGNHYILEPTCTETKDAYNGFTDRYYECSYTNENQILKTALISDETDPTSQNNIYYKNLYNWFNTTDLNTYEFITTNKLCQNDWYTYTATGEDYLTYDGFDCAYSHNSKTVTYNQTSNFYNGKVGYLTYGDLIRSGIGKSGSTLSDSYLIPKNNNQYIISDKKSVRSDSDSYGYKDNREYLYYITPTGLGSKYFSRDYRASLCENCDYYTLINNAEQQVFDKLLNSGKDKLRLITDVFRANSVKPTMIIDLSNKILEGTGKKDNSYIIVDKK